MYGLPQLLCFDIRGCNEITDNRDVIFKKGDVIGEYTGELLILENLSIIIVAIKGEEPWYAIKIPALLKFPKLLYLARKKGV